VSVFPALMAIPMLLILKEPESWKKAKAQAAESKGEKSVGSLADLFGHPRWRKHLLVGVCLGVAGMVGLWGIAFFSPELITTAFKDRPLLVEDVIRPADIFSALNTENNPAALSLRRKLSPGFIARAEQLRNASVIPPGDVDALVTEINRLLRQDHLYDAAAFQGVKLKKTTKNLIQVLQKKPDRQNLVFQNRQLVEQVFPGTIRELQTTIDKTRGKGT